MGARAKIFEVSSDILVAAYFRQFRVFRAICSSSGLQWGSNPPEA